MRLWNLMTGKKAGVLNFNKDLLQSVREGKWGTGEGRKVEWNSKGEEFAVAFEWGAVIFGVVSFYSSCWSLYSDLGYRILRRRVLFLPGHGASFIK